MKIIVHPLLPTGNFLNCRIGIEKDFPDDANEMESVFEVWDNIISMHMKRYPHLYNDKGEPLYEKIPQEEECKGITERVIEQPQTKETQEERIIKDLGTCKELKVLETYSLLAKNNPKIQEAYNLKLKELQP